MKGSNPTEVFFVRMYFCKILSFVYEFTLFSGPKMLANSVADLRDAPQSPNTSILMQFLGIFDKLMGWRLHLIVAFTSPSQPILEILDPLLQLHSCKLQSTCG